jgi:adenylosuccinate synthase
MKHSCLINGYDSLNLTKLDVLDDLEEIKVGVKYLVNEKEVSGFPGMKHIAKLSFPNRWLFVAVADLDLLAQVAVVYVVLPGWKTPISSVKSFEELPENCRKYIGFIEGYLGASIGWIGVGPGRESMVRKE